MLRNSCAIDKIVSCKVMNIQATRTEVLSVCKSDVSAARVLSPFRTNK